MRIPCDTIDMRGLFDFETLLPATDPRNTDRPTHESPRKNCPILEKAYMFVQNRDFCEARLFPLCSNMILMIPGSTT